MAWCIVRHSVSLYNASLTRNVVGSCGAHVRASESALKAHLSGSEFGVRASACIDDVPLCCMTGEDPALTHQVASSASHKHIHAYRAIVASAWQDK